MLRLSPNCVELAAAMASSSDVDRDDRRGRPEDLLLGDAHRRRHRRRRPSAGRRSPRRRSPSRATSPPVSSCAPRRRRSRCSRGCARSWRLVDHRARRRRRRRARRRSRSARARATSASVKSPSTPRCDDQPRRRGAALAGGAEGAPERALDGQLDVGVVQHHDAVLAAELERHLLEHRAAGRGDAAAGLGAAGEEDGRGARVADHRLTGLLVAEDDVDDPRRQPRLLERSRRSGARRAACPRPA